VTIIFVTGTGTDVGKTVVTAAVAELYTQAGKRVAVIKPAQTGVLDGEPGDASEVERLTSGVTCIELVRYPEPLAPRTAARRSHQEPLSIERAVDVIHQHSISHDVVLVEGAGGLLVQFDEDANTIADMAARLESSTDVRMLVVVAAGLGTLNATALTAEALRHRRLALMGIVVGRWPQAPDLAACCNLQDLPSVAGAPLLGVLPDGFPLEPQRFRSEVARHFTPTLHGSMDVESFVAQHAPD
jgi:dethiobiotin synthetase